MKFEGTSDWRMKVSMTEKEVGSRITEWNNSRIRMQVVSYPSLTWRARHCSRPSCWRAPSPCPGWSSQCPSSRTRPTPLWTILEWNGPELSIFKLELYLEELVTDLFISLKSMLPLPSTSYILKAQPNFSSGEPLDVVWRASMNSLQIYHHLLRIF